MRRLDIKKIITKYIDQTASPEEMDSLYDWIKKESNHEVFKKMVEADFLIKYRNRTWDTKKSFEQFLKTIEYKESRKIVPNIKVWRYAAAAIIIVATSALYLFSRTDLQTVASPEIDLNQITLQLDNGELITLDPARDAIIESSNGGTVVSIVQGVVSQKNKEDGKDSKANNILKVPHGKKLSVRLHDGTEVMMNSGSTLTYPTSFAGSAKREVHLKGEAFFEVTKNPDQPFIVSADNTFTRVFGTVFNVSAYEEDEKIEVVLVEGAVGVGLADSDAEKNFQILKPSQKASNQGTMENEFAIEDVDVAPYISWTQGVLTFESEKISKIIKQLQRRFDVHIINQNEKLAEHRFSGSFDEEGIDLILNTIQTHTPFDYTKKGDTITITAP